MRTFCHSVKLERSRHSRRWPGGIPSIVLGLGILLLSVAPVAFGQSPVKEKSRVAVLDLELIGSTKEEGAAVVDQLRNEFVNFGTFTVLSRDQIEKLLGEQAFQSGGFTDQSEAVRVGKLLNAKFILTGRLTKLSGAYQLNVQLIEVLTAEIIRSEAVLHRGDVLDLITKQIPPLAARLAKVERAAPPPVVQVPNKEQPPPAENQSEHPAMSSKKPSWPVWMGASLLIAGAAFQSTALSTNKEAENLANEARTLSSTSKFSEAERKRADADSKQGTAAILSIGGAIFLMYYMMSDPPATAANTTDRVVAGAPFQLLIETNAILAGWQLRW